MNFQVKVTPDFERSVKGIAKKYKSIYKDLSVLIDQLEQKPDTGTFLGNGLYKIRLQITGLSKGKSGGGRVITYLKVSNSTVLLAEIYIKSEFDTVDEGVIIARLNSQGLL